MTTVEDVENFLRLFHTHAKVYVEIHGISVPVILSVKDGKTSGSLQLTESGINCSLDKEE
jgi:hypothetical protein